MNRFTSLACSLTLALVAPLTLVAEEPTVAVTPIKGNLYLLQGRGGNVVASVGDDGVLLVDTDYGEYASAYAAALEELGAQNARFVLNTHWHFDHIGGNQYWGERSAVIVAHENIRKRMSTRQEITALSKVVEPSPAPALPVVTYGESLALHFNGDDIEVQHFPSGHTDGDSIVFFSRENVVHMGDHMFDGRFPFVDISSGGNVFGYIDNLARLLERIDDQVVIVPGHGKGTVAKADLAAYHRVLADTAGAVKTALAGGESVEEIVARGLGEQYESYGKGFISEESWIGFIAGSL